VHDSCFVYADLANFCSAADLLHVFASPLAKVVGSAAIRSGCAYLRVREQGVMQLVHGVEQHRAPNSPDQRYEPAASPVVLGAFPHGAMHREGNEQAKCL